MTAIQGGHTVEAEGIEIHGETLKKTTTTDDSCSSLKPKRDSGLLSKVKLFCYSIPIQIIFTFSEI